MSKLVSVIIPAYNCEKYLAECIESILRQSYPKIEILLIDDGSEDATSAICDIYNEKYNNIKFFHTENHGQLLARKYGFDRSNGEYILFVDSDDWIDEDMCRKLVEKIESQNVDLVTSGIFRHDILGEIQNTWIDNLENKTYYTDDDLKLFYDNLILSDKRSSSIPGGVMNNMAGKLFSRELVKETFSDMCGNIGKLRIEEDFVFCVVYCLKCKGVTVTHDCFYHYRYNVSSVINNEYIDFLENKNIEWKMLIRLLGRSQYADTLIRQYKKRFYYTVCAGMSSCMGIDEIQKYQCPDYNAIMGKNIVLFGAGRVGRDYYKDLKRRGIDIVAWIDNSSVKHKEIDVLEPIHIAEYEYDLVICAVLEEGAANNMKVQLIELGVPREKILWEKPKNLLDELLI